jgi:hypothetical protein
MKYAASFGAALALCAVAPANAQQVRTFVSTVGDDLAACSRAAPCKTFAGALSKTGLGGEITCLDAGGYGSVTITKSITLNCEGVAGSILGSAGIVSITINAGTTGDVALRNINLFGNGGPAGIRVTTARTVTVQNVRINDFTGEGIHVLPGTTSTNLYVRDSRITDVASGIVLTSSGGTIKAQIDNTRIDGNTAGLTIGSPNVVASISNSVIANSGTALFANGAGTINASRNTIARNTQGARVGVSGGAINLSQNAFDDNTVAISFVAGGIVSSAGDNGIIGPPGQAPTGAAISFR